MGGLVLALQALLGWGLGRQASALWLLPALLLAAALLLFAAELVRPPRTDYGSTWRAYLAEPENSLDVLYLGSSLAYCDFDPVEVYRHSGLTGCVVSGSAQTMPLTYWYLRQALETQRPQAVVLEGDKIGGHRRLFPEI